MDLSGCRPFRFRAPQQVMAGHHNFLHRNVILLRACSEDVDADDEARLDRHGIRWGPGGPLSSRVFDQGV